MAYITDQRAAAKTAAFTVGDYRYYLVNATGGAVTATLRPAADSQYHVFSFIKTDSSANAVTIDAYGSETINGALTIALTAQYEGVTIVCNGTSWAIVT